ncbi:MAG: tripartite tricarboxylate transporter substrate binding protein [Lautropia sp.]|nr:tripartite tricarboxylate transporter substrate binding protein [Lautropia sp.]
MSRKNSHLDQRRLAVGALAGLGMLALSPTLPAQEAYPSKPLTMVVPFPPGGVADTVGRPVAEAFSRILGQPVVVENKAGAGGGIGMAQVAKARPDGYTLLLALSSITILPEADRVLERTPMYQLKDLLPIARFTADPTVLVVRAESPWKTAKEFIEAAKARPGVLSFGSSGNYGTMHVPMEMLKQVSGTYMLHVPYTGAGPAIIGLIGEQVDALATGPATILQHVKSGRLRPLAHWGEGRLAALPDVPSLKELGYPATFSQWAGVFVPAGTPEAILTRLREASRQAATDDRLVKAIGTAGSPVLYLDAPQFSTFVGQDAKTMKAVVDRIGKQ